MNTVSKINPLLTLEYMRTESENKYFDRKSGRIRASDLAQHISAFANAAGGTLVIGISDKDRAVEGINSCGESKINEFINSPKDCCRPMPRYREEFIDVVNKDGEPDRLLLLHIESSKDQIIRTTNDRTYLRIGDKSKEMLGENLRNLEYAKGSRHYEDEINYYATVDNLDEELLTAYKERIGAEDLSVEQVLAARGFLQKQDGKNYLTNAAVLLFAKNVMQFYPNCRVRFLRIDGRELQVGSNLNVVKDKNLDLPILRIIDRSKNYITDQLRVFTTQDRKTGKFIETPEYPEFPWLEGVVNAVAHRDYAMTGAYIKVSMYDDRLEIESPGCLPDLVTVDNIRNTRFSRNPKISRVLTEFGYVRELNEGVKKIYADMEAAGLPEPEYRDSANSVRLVLRNGIDNWSARNKQTAGEDAHVSVEDTRSTCYYLDDIENEILLVLRENGSASRYDLEQHIQKPKSTVSRRIRHLVDLGILKANGGIHNPNRTYEIEENTELTQTDSN